MIQLPSAEEIARKRPQMAEYKQGIRDGIAGSAAGDYVEENGGTDAELEMYLSGYVMGFASGFMDDGGANARTTGGRRPVGWEITEKLLFDLDDAYDALSELALKKDRERIQGYLREAMEKIEAVMDEQYDRTRKTPVANANANGKPNGEKKL